MVTLCWQMRGLSIALTRGALVALTFCHSAARADVIDDWNGFAIQTVLAQEMNPIDAARNLGTVHIAIFEVMNYVEGGYIPRLLVSPPMPSGMSSQVAAAAAAHYALVDLYPRRQAALDTELKRSVATLSVQLDHGGAVITGSQLGAIIYLARKSDRILQNVRALPQGGDSTHDAVAYIATIERYVAAKSMKPIERARIYAFAALATDEPYAFNRDVMLNQGVRHGCDSCTFGAAVREILASHSSTTKVQESNVASIVAVTKIPIINSRVAIDDATGARIGRQDLSQYAVGL
ncbi:MAG: hypothetical protein ACKVQT_20500 [Burkholderiales bacterium]